MTPLLLLAALALGQSPSPPAPVEKNWYAAAGGQVVYGWPERSGSGYVIRYNPGDQATAPRGETPAPGGRFVPDGVLVDGLFRERAITGEYSTNDPTFTPSQARSPTIQAGSADLTKYAPQIVVGGLAACLLLYAFITPRKPPPRHSTL